MSSGVVATFSLTLLFFLINRLRHRKVQGRESHLHMHSHRPPNHLISDDQRSIGSYIAGNISYNGEIYDQNTNPYQLWKPPNGCFPRGEAPPPYEEVIGLSQASCTNVSLGGHHLPLSICASDATAPVVGDFQGFVPQTNLINININNAGTITSVAAGENHQAGAPSTNNNSNPYK